MIGAAVFEYAGAALGGIFALIAVLRARRSVAHWTFAAGMIILGLEGVCGGLIATAPSPLDLARYQRWRLLGLSLLPGFWLLFSQTYARGKALVFLKKRRLEIAAALSLPTALALTFRDQLVGAVLRDEATMHWTVRLERAGIVLYGLLLVSSVLVVMNLERTYRAAVGTMRWRIKFMLLGVGVLFLVRIYTSSQALLFGSVDLSVESLNSGAMLLGAALIARSFLRRGHFDVDVYPSQTFLQGSITIVVAGVYLMIVGSLAKVTAYLGGDNAFAMKGFLTLVALVGLAVVLQSDKARLHLRRFVSRNFQRPLYDYRTVWSKFTEATDARVEQTELCRALVKLVADMFESLSVGIWLLDEEHEVLALVASTFLEETGSNRPELSRSDTQVAIAHLLGHPDPADIENRTESWALAIRSAHQGQFSNGGHRVIVPLVSQGGAIGMMTVGDRVAGVKFTLQDFDMLSCAGHHASASLRNVQMSKKLLEAKELEAFQTMAAFFVHDLKNAASTLSLLLQNLPEHFEDPEFREDALRGVSKGVDHINRLIARLGQIRRDQALVPTPTDLNRVISEALETLDPVTGSMLVEDLNPLPLVMLDRAQILKVVTNLLLNAVEALGPDGRVSISTRATPGGVILAVGDNGCGMALEFLSQELFRPFKTTKKNGLGIGMFQSKMIVEAHGGRISVVSELRKGSTFEVFLPATDPSK